MRYICTITEEKEGEVLIEKTEVSSRAGFRQTADKILKDKFPAEIKEYEVVCKLENPKQEKEFEFLYVKETTTKLKWVKTLRTKT